MTIHYANPDETTFVGAVFQFWYCGTTIRCYQRPGRYDDALETITEWAAENGHKEVFALEPDYDSAAKELGVVCRTAASDEELNRIREAAEEGMTQTEAGWLCNDEYTLIELSEDPLPTPTFDRFDICQAYASYWAVHHMGQGSDGYQRLCAAMNLCTNAIQHFHDLTENGQAIYRKLCLKDGR